MAEMQKIKTAADENFFMIIHSEILGEKNLVRNLINSEKMNNFSRLRTMRQVKRGNFFGGFLY